jgi:hypothetical protein
MKRKQLLTYAATLLCFVLLFAEGGWQRMVVLAGGFVVLLVGAIVWVAERATREKSN